MQMFGFMLCTQLALSADAQHCAHPAEECFTCRHMISAEIGTAARVCISQLAMSQQWDLVTHITFQYAWSGSPEI